MQKVSGSRVAENPAYAISSTPNNEVRLDSKGLGFRGYSAHIAMPLKN